MRTTLTTAMVLSGVLVTVSCASSPPPERAATSTSGSAESTYVILDDSTWTPAGESPDGHQLRYRVDAATVAQLAAGVVFVHRTAAGDHALRIVRGLERTSIASGEFLVALDVDAISAYKVFSHLAVEIHEAVDVAVAKDNLVLGDSGITLSGIALAYTPTVNASISTENASTYSIEGPVTSFSQEVLASFAGAVAATDPTDVASDLPVVTHPFRQDLDVTINGHVQRVPFFGTIEVIVTGRYRASSEGAGTLSARSTTTVPVLAQKVAWGTTWTTEKQLEGKGKVERSASTIPGAATVEAGLHLAYRIKIYDFVVPTFDQDLASVLENKGTGVVGAKSWARTTFHKEDARVDDPTNAASTIKGRVISILDEEIKGPIEHGLVSRPVSDAAREGWGQPYADTNGVLINPPLGTVFGHNPFDLLQKGATDWAVTRSFDGADRLAPGHEGYGNLDWVYKRNGAVAGYVTWKGPHGRNLPEMPLVNVSSLYNVHLDNYEQVRLPGNPGNTFYVYRGSRVFLDGKLLYDFGAFVSGAAIRDVGDRRFLLAVTTDFAEPVDRLWSVELDVPSPTAVSAGTVTLPDGYVVDDVRRANSYFCNESATRCSSIIAALHAFSYTSGYVTTTVTDPRYHTTRESPTHPTYDNGTLTSSTPVTLHATIDWTSPAAAVVSFAPAITAEASSSATHTFHDGTAPRYDVGHYDEAASTDVTVSGAPIAIDYVGDQEVVLTGSTSTTSASTHADTYNVVGGDTIEETSNEVSTETYSSDGFSVSGGRSKKDDTRLLVDRASETYDGSVSSTSSHVEIRFLHADLRHGQFVYLETTTNADQSGQGRLGASFVATTTTTVTTKLFHNTTLLADTSTTATASETDVRFMPTIATKYFEDGGVVIIESEDGHAVGSGWLVGMTLPESWGVRLVDTTTGRETSEFQFAPEFAVSSTGDWLSSIAIPTFGPSGMSEPIRYINALSDGVDPTMLFELQGANPRFEYIGLK